MARKKIKELRAQKEINIRSRLMRGIVVILMLTILLPVIAYNWLPEWVYYLVPATRLWLATEDLTASYGEGFLDKIEDVEKEYDTSVEVFTADSRLVYSTKAVIDALPADLNDAETLDDAFLYNYTTRYGERTVGDKSYLIKTYDTGAVTVTFIDCYQYLPDGGWIEVYMQVSQTTSTTKITFLIAFLAIMIFLTFGLSAIWVYIKKFTNPVNKMVEVTGKMAQLDFSQTCPHTGLTELNSLSNGINEMSRALDTALTDLQQKNEKLREDIENERTIDNLRQTFVGGISHELKTPIAIIQGYAEGAKMFYASGNVKAADEYCDVIIRETGRMNSMIVKLLEITKYTSGAYEPQRENFDLREFVIGTVDANAELLAERGVLYENTVPAGLTANGDPTILPYVLNNYFSNALSHCEGDEKRIRISCDDVGDKYRIRVFNTGKPIAGRDIDKIWDSFYRADKALSRSQGRFGLGLSIVRAIQNLHGEAYGVENKPDGVEFWFDLAKA